MSRVPPKKLNLIITCEHASNAVPESLHKFIAKSLLNTHRGIDFGAISFARALSRRLRAPLYGGKVSRLVVDLNRSIGHPTLFGTFVRSQSPSFRQNIIRRYYLPFRQAVEKLIKKQLGPRQEILHLSIHSFTPYWKEKQRKTDIGFLFDPSRKSEAEFCRQWRREIHQMDPLLNIHLNRPYRGTADGFTTYLRSKFSGRHYAGIEIEINQKYPLSQPAKWRRLQTLLEESLLRLL